MNCFTEAGERMVREQLRELTRNARVRINLYQIHRPWWARLANVFRERPVAFWVETQLVDGRGEVIADIDHFDGSGQYDVGPAEVL